MQSTKGSGQRHDVALTLNCMTLELEHNVNHIVLSSENMCLRLDAAVII